MKSFSGAALIASFALSSFAPAQMRSASGNVVTPDSSIERSTDIGMRAHTNIHVYLPTKPMKEVQPFGAPYSGYSYETPESLACVYGLVKTVAGCAPNAANTNPTGGSKMIAIVDAMMPRMRPKTSLPFRVSLDCRRQIFRPFTPAGKSLPTTRDGNLKNRSTCSGLMPWRPERRSFSSKRPQAALPI